MIKKNRYIILELALIMFLGLTPLLWFKPGCLITGGDLDYPLNPVGRFIERTYTWNSVFFGGTDRSMDITTLFLTGFRAILHILGFSLIMSEKINFIFWFTLAGFSMYFLISQLFSKKDNVMRLVSTVFYMFNFYQIYAWEIARIGELAAIVITPALLGLFIKGIEKRISYRKSAVIIVLFSVIGMGIGVQPPMLGIFIFTIFLYFIFHLIISKLHKKSVNIFQQIRFFIFFILLFFSSNMLWILPVTNFTIQSGYISTSRATEVFNSIKLLEWCSKYNSLLNTIRLFGDIFWFDGWGGEFYSTFFQIYQTNWILIYLSFMLPILAFSALMFSRHRYVLFFTIIGCLGIILGTGIHQPFGNLFLWMFKNITGFWIYRAPWQKFGILTAIGYSFLAGITCSKIYEYLRKHPISYKSKNVLIETLVKKIHILFISVILILNIVYCYPLLLGKMLPSSEGDVGYHEKFDVGYHQKFPDYIFEASDWINSMDEEFKILTLPDDKTSVYDWGYAGPKDITLNLFKKGIVFRQYGEGTAPPHSVDNVRNVFINSLYKNLTTNSAKILDLLNVRYILQRNDFRYDFFGDVDSPEFIKSQLDLQRGIELEKTFGKWDFYRVDNITPHIYGTNNIVYINGDTNSLFSLASFDDLSQSAIFFSDIPQEKNISVLDTPLSYKNIITMFVHDGRSKPINWTIFSDGSYEARSYIDWKGVISTDGKGDLDMLIFQSPDECPYKFISVPNWYALNSTLLYIKTGSEPFEICNIYADGKLVNDIVGIWWETDWVGMSSKGIRPDKYVDTSNFPITIPAGEKAIIQINHLTKTIVLQTNSSEENESSDNFQNYLFKSNEENKPHITFQKLNPTKYNLHINASKPFLLIFSDNYHPQWKAYYGSLNWLESLLTKSVSDKYHFSVNGYANSWYIDKTGDYIMTVYFWPQNLFYIGSIVSIITMILSIGFFIIRKKEKKKIKS